MAIIVEEWRPGACWGEWRPIGTTATISEAARMARQAYDPDGWGGFRHPDGGPKCGTIRARGPQGEIWVWDGDEWADVTVERR